MVFNKGWFCIDRSIRVCLRLSTAEGYVVTNGKILSLEFFFCVKAAGLAAKLTPEKDLSIVLGWPRVLKCCLNFTRLNFLKCCFWRVSSKQSYCFAFNDTIFYTRWMAWVKMFILKGFSSFVVGFDVRNRFVNESFSFDYYIEKSNLVLWYLGREFDARVELVSFVQ